MIIEREMIMKFDYIVDNAIRRDGLILYRLLYYNHATPSGLKDILFFVFYNLATPSELSKKTPKA